MWILIPFLLALAFSLFLLNYAVYYPVKKAYNLTLPCKRLLMLILSLLTLTIVAGETIRRLWGIYPLSSVGMVILGTYSLAFTVMTLNLLLNLLITLFAGILPFSRERFFRTSTTVALLLIPLLSAIAVWNNCRLPRVKELTIYSEKVTAELDGMKILFVSDFHLIGASAESRLQKTTDLINRQHPDLILLGGDIIDEPWYRIRHLTTIFQQKNATYGIYGVSGNHDYYSQLKTYLDFSEASGIINLFNENIRIKEGLTIIGIPDKTATGMGWESPDPQKAFIGAAENDFLIFLAHQPLYYREAAAADLILAGHTHRGQLPPMNLLVALNFKYPYGLYQPAPGKYIYTTSGVYTWGPPMRLFTNNEVVVFTLKKP